MLHAPPAAAQGRYQPQGAAQRQFEQGLALLQAADAARGEKDEARAREKAGEAADAFERAIESDPAFLDAYAKFGLATYSIDASDRAIARLKPAVEKNPDVPELQFWLGNHQLKAGQTAEGITHLERASRSGDVFPEADLVLGTHFYKAGELPRAQAALEKYLRVRPDDLAARGTLGNAYFKAEKYPQALQAFEEVQRASPDNIQVQVNLGTCHYQLGNYAKAVELLSDALKKEPTRESVVFNLGQAYFQWKKFDDAVRTYRQYVAMKPDNFNGHYFLASSLMEQGPAHDTEALASFAESIRLKPDVAIAHYKVGLVQLRRGSLDDADKSLATAHRLAPTDPWVMSAQGTVARRRGNLDLAGNLHQQAVDAAPDKARLQANLALTRLLRKQLVEADSAVTRAVALDAGDPYVRQTAATVLATTARARLQDNDAAGAEARLRQAITAQPDAPELRSDLAVVLLAEGKAPEALTESEAASTAAPTNGAVALARARVLLGAGKPAEARAALASAPEAAKLPAAPALLAAVALRTAEPDTAIELLEPLEKAGPLDPASLHNLALARLEKAVRELHDTKDSPAGLEALRAATKTDDALVPAVQARAAYLSLIAALRRGDGAAATQYQARLPGTSAAAALKDLQGALVGAAPGHLEMLAAFTHLVSRREDRAVAALEALKASHKPNTPEARLLRRAYDKQAEKAWAAGNLADVAKMLKGSAGLGRDAVVDHNQAALELRQNRKAKVEPRLRAVLNQVAEAWFNLGVTLDAQGRHEDAYRAFLHAGQSGGAFSAKARDLAEAKRRIFGFTP